MNYSEYINQEKKILNDLIIGVISEEEFKKKAESLQKQWLEEGE